eukprot:2536575-Amphidinium_carterae.1
MSAPAMTALFNMQLGKLECEHQVSVSWTRSFLKDLGMNWRQFIHKSSASIPEETAIMYYQNINEKIRYFQHLHSVEDTRETEDGGRKIKMQSNQVILGSKTARVLPTVEKEYVHLD